MVSFKTSREVAGSPQDVWALVSDLGRIHRYHPHVERAHWEGDNEGLGGRARWIFPQRGGEVVEEVSAYVEGEHVAVRFVEGSLPVHFAETGFTLSPGVAGGTRVDIAMDFEMKGGVLGWLLGSTLGKRRLQARMETYLDGLDAYLRTGTKSSS